jgi:hypothetical protein
LVRAALRAAAERAALVREAAAVRPWRAIARGEAVERGSRFRAPVVARDRRADRVAPVPLRPRATSRSALRRVRADVDPRRGAGSGTPARRALDSPIAIVCFGDREPCLPSRT